MARSPTYGRSQSLLHGRGFYHGLLTYCLSAMQYGKQTVPISSEEENHLKYLPEKDMQAIGFVSLDQIPRHMYMKVLTCPPACLLFVPQLQPIQTAQTGDQVQHEWSHCTPILAVACLSTRCGRDRYDLMHVGISCASTLKSCCCQVECVVRLNVCVRTQLCAEVGSSCSCSVQSRLIYQYL